MAALGGPGLTTSGSRTATQRQMASGKGDQSITHDLVTIMRRFRLLGFNAVRLPFSMKDLFTASPRDFNNSCTVTLRPGAAGRHHPTRHQRPQ